MHKIKNFFTNLGARIVGWSLTKKIIYGLLLILVLFLGYKIFGPKDNSANITTDMAHVSNLKRTVLATGQVTSTTDLSLSFGKSGTVKSLRVKVGDQVRAGAILATLDQGTELAALTSARGAEAAAQARYQKILDGASSEEVALAQVALDNAKSDQIRVKSQQQILVENAYKKLLSSSLEAVATNGSSSTTAPTISGSYNKTSEGQIHISVYTAGDGTRFNASGIVTASGVVSTSPQSVGNSGLSIAFASLNPGVTDWVIDIPNKNASDYVTNYNAYQSALKTEESALGTSEALVNQRNAELSLKKSMARPADLNLAQADILSAQGQVQSASANFEHTLLRAPTNGTVTKVDIKLGELAQAQNNVMVIQNVSDLYLEANINEANITSIIPDAHVDLTFDAFGSDKVFTGKVLRVDPSSTLISGVVNYKVTASIDSTPELRPGMTANMTILVSAKENIISVPSRAVLTDKSGKKTIRLVTNPKTKEWEQVEVTTGMEGDGGQVEITSGLNTGDEFVVLIKA
ncbi:MAG: efflux RND transporter periplasmic adaptor subunit [Candidatus Pacebacteria bacterium]|nr:efflux RND transporter periplasmic adaptor subunit [Candidatus Paceibacterota bacterium]